MTSTPLHAFQQSDSTTSTRFNAPADGFSFEATRHQADHDQLTCAVLSSLRRAYHESANNIPCIRPPSNSAALHLPSVRLHARLVAPQIKSIGVNFRRIGNLDDQVAIGGHPEQQVLAKAIFQGMATPHSENHDQGKAGCKTSSSLGTTTFLHRHRVKIVRRDFQH